MVETGQGRRLDPITLEVLWNRLISVVNEQAGALIRTSFTTILRDSGDLSAGVFDPRGNMIAQAVTGTPGHINSMATCIHHFLAAYPAETLRPGDVLITNDPYATSGQLHDFTIITPIFRGETLVAFFGSTCHAIDVGGRGMGADARSLYEEGIYVPVTKWYDRGTPNEELRKLLRYNVREPDQVLGDLHAQVVGNEVGGARLLEFMAEFGLESLVPLADEIIERSERAMRAAIATVPDGVYENTGHTDGFDAPVKLHVRITKQGDSMHVDWTGTDPESPWGINVVLNYTHAYVTYALKCALCPEVPNNEGSFRPVTVYAPPGCLLNAQHPAALNARHIVGHFLPGVIFGALAPVLLDRVMAEGAANIWAVQLTGKDAAGRLWTYPWFSCGGTGARPTKDGLHTTAFPSGITGVPVEAIETLAPIRVFRREIAQDSGGPGRFRGGCGQFMEVGVLTGRPYNLSAGSDRTRVPAKGYAGGTEGGRGAVYVGEGQPEGWRKLPNKAQLTLQPTERFTLQLPGGGGFWDPFTRDPQAVLDDVLDEFVSLDAARERYGVVVDPATMQVDAVATATLRASRSGGR